ncbi:MAG: hypothetical protein ACRENM_04930, partial [Candidatus Dormibacteraceae bacterium]
VQAHSDWFQPSLFGHFWGLLVPSDHHAGSVCIRASRSSVARNAVEWRLEDDLLGPVFEGGRLDYLLLELLLLEDWYRAVLPPTACSVSSARAGLRLHAEGR